MSEDMTETGEGGAYGAWAANWYMTRRHIDMGGHALCSQYTQTWPDGYESDRHRVPPSDSPEVQALSPCVLCTRKALSLSADLQARP